MDGGTAQPNFIFRGKAETADPDDEWTITGIPTAGATQATLTFKVNNSKSASKYAVSSTTSGVTVGNVVTGTEAAKPFTISYPITISAGVSTMTLVFTNSLAQNVRIDDIQLVTK
jgi:hypothetical protein